MKPVHLAAGFVAAASLAAPAAAQALIIDFNPDVDDYEPAGLHAVPGGALFSARTPDEGRELWWTSGAPGSANLVLDLQAGAVGSDPHGFQRAPDGTTDALFVATTAAEGAELWRTDATAPGTQLVADVNPGPLSSHPSDLVRRTGRTFFFADDGFHGRELWTTDGTGAGTQLVVDARPGPLGAGDVGARIVGFGTNEVLFTGRFADGWQLWRSDGTPAGTSFLALLTSDPTAPPRSFATDGGRAVFLNWTPAEGEEPWVTDGTALGTQLLLDVHPGPEGSRASMVVAVGGTFYLGLDDGTATGRELWSSDGTGTGTQLLADLWPSTPTAPNLALHSDPVFVGTLQGDLVFSATGGFQGRPLHRTDGTAAGTTQLTSVQSPQYNALPGVEWNGHLYFYGFPSLSSPQFGVWRTDGVAPEEFVANVRPSSLAPANAGLLLTGSGTPPAAELWYTDGTSAGTVPFPPLTNPPPTGSSDFQILGSFRDRCIFASADYSPSYRTFSVQAFPDSLQILGLTEDPTSLAITPEFLFFFASIGGVQYPHVATGYELSQVRILDFPNSDGGESIVLGDEVAFSARGANGQELYVTDGTLPAGFRLVADLVPGSLGSDPRNFRVCDGRLYFSATSVSRLEEELWVSDGTAAGTVLLASAPTSSSETPDFTCVGSTVYFAFRDAAGGQELWSTDGTPGGTGPLLDLHAGPADALPRELVRTGDRLVFLAEDATSRKLWSTDGTVTGTSMLLDLGGGPLSDLGALADEQALFFHEVAGQSVLWTTDGLVATPLRPLAPPNAPGVPGWAALGSSTLCFAADDGVHGPELWRSDGTAVGTCMLFDLGPTGVAPSQMTRLGNQVLFRGNDGIVGTELFAFDFALLADHVVARYGFGCPTLTGFEPEIDLVGEPTVSAGSFDVVLRGAPPNRTAVLVVGEGAAQFELVAGCVLWPNSLNLVSAMVTTDGAGEASLTLPTSPFLFDRVFLGQWLVNFPSGNPLSIDGVTGGLEVIVGP